ncbi:MAG TPA: hypothetical protein VI911_10825 [Patescibacteria group bacterium]|nr:hypothetical protein [Patescibacteria group bacterium]
MWKRTKIIFNAIKDFVLGILSHILHNITNAIDTLAWTVIPIVFIAGYLLLMLPQLAVFAVIASFTNGINDPILKFGFGFIVFAAMEFILLSPYWIIVCILGMPEMLRFANHVKSSYERRLVEEEIREAESKELLLSDIYERLKNHG